MPQAQLQPAPFRTPMLDDQGQLVETWRRFFLSSANLINALLLTVQSLGGSKPSLMMGDDADQGDGWVIPGPPGVIGLPGVVGPPGIMVMDDAGLDETWPLSWPSFDIGQFSAVQFLLGTVLMEDIANRLAQRNGVNPQVFQIYNTFTDPSNYERMTIGWGGNIFFLTTAAAGTGVTTRDMQIGTNGASSLYIVNAGAAVWRFFGGNMLAFTDNTQDIGASSSSRPRTLYAATSVIQGSSLALGATSTDGYVAQNTTLSTAGVPVQRPPRIRLNGHVWNTTAVAADNTDDWNIETLPVSGLTPSSFLNFNWSANGAAYVNKMQMSSGGILSVATISLTNNITLVGVGFILSGGGTGLFDFVNAAFNAGFGLDGSTDAIMKVRTRAQNADAAITYSSYTHSGAEIDKTYTVVVPVTGDTKTMATGQSRIIFNPAGTLALLTVTLPGSPVDGQVAGMSFTQIITGLTINAPGGATVVAPPTTAAVDSAFRFLYQASSTSWFPCS